MAIPEEEPRPALRFLLLQTSLRGEALQEYLRRLSGTSTDTAPRSSQVSAHLLSSRGFPNAAARPELLALSTAAHQAPSGEQRGYEGACPSVDDDRVNCQ